MGDLVTMRAGGPYLLCVAQPPYAVLTWIKSSIAAGGLVWCQPQSERAAGCSFVAGCPLGLLPALTNDQAPVLFQTRACVW